MKNPQAETSILRFALYVLIALLIATPGIILRISSVKYDPWVNTLVFGAAVVAAGFLLSWSAEAAESRVAQALIVAILALITVLPEYAVDIYFAWQAGRAPLSGYPQFAAANMTGANRMLVGVAWPMLVFVNWWKTRDSAIQLKQENTNEILFLGLASLYAFVILIKNRIDIYDSAALLTIFGMYMYRASRGSESKNEVHENAAGKEARDKEEEEEAGPAAALLLLPVKQQVFIMSAMTIVAGTIIFLMAEPFAESLIETGTGLGIDHFLLIQWLAPLASEAPTITIALLLVLSEKARTAMATMLSDKINQWTLLVGMLPLALSFGAGKILPLNLDVRQHEEFFLTATQSLFALSLLLGFRLSAVGALFLFGLFFAQIFLAVSFRADEIRAVSHLTQLGWAYVVLTLLTVIHQRKALLRFFK